MISGDAKISGTRRVVVRGAVVLCLTALLPWIAATRADDALTKGTLEWKSGPVPTYQQDAATLALVVQAGRESGVRHFVVQFNRPLLPSERAPLSAAGVTLLNYVGDNAFYASVDPERADGVRLAQVAAIRCVLPVELNWKLHGDFLSGFIPDWAIVAPRQDSNSDKPEPASPTVVAAYVLFHGDVPVATIGKQVCRAHGATVVSTLESINGLVIELPLANVSALAAEDGVEWIEPPLPKFSELNNDNRARTGANTVAAPPYNLDGTGVTVLVYDGGTGLATHADFGGRLFVRDSSGLNDHSTHVAGTIGGSGAASSGLYRGMAPGVIIESYGFEQVGGLHQGFLYTDPGDIEADYSQAINTYGADLASNSIGTNTAPNGFPCDWEGNYGATSVLIDTIVRGDGSNPLFSQPFRVVWANGNERQVSTCLGVEGFPSPYHSTAPPACAKNHITVGALNSNDDSITDFTSFGPADDGRMKPDLSAPGCQTTDDDGVTSCSSSGGYTTKCGTSMACPTVAGLSALLLQDYRQQFPGQPDFRNSTLKILLAHTAVDIGNVGPDYQSGYGSVRIQPAIDFMRAGNFAEGTLSQGDTVSMVVLVTPSDTQLKVTLAWDDVPGTPSVNPELVNDLDLKVFDSGNNQYFPWTLNKLNPAAPAVRTQANHVDNIEQVVIDNPAPGAYRVEVYGFNVPSGPQPFSICASPLLVQCSSAGTLTLDRPKYACQSEATLRVVDCDLNTSDEVVDTVTVNIASTSNPTGLPVLLTETAAESATFIGTIPLNTSGGGGALLIASGDTVTATYIDADDGNGGTNVPVTATALVDCVPPVISNLQVDPINPHDATITLTTDEPAQVTIHYGLGCGSLTGLQSTTGYHTTHSIKLSSLVPGTTYFYKVSAVDEAGNTNNDPNCYSFSTPDIPDYFTQLFTTDNDLDFLTLQFTPNASIDFYAGCAQAITALPTDPAGGTNVTLTDDSYASVTLTGGAQVYLYGVAYGTFYIGSNGYITFGSGDSDYSETLAEHFAKPRIAGLYDDLDPAQGGTVSWKQLSDRVAVTWLNVTEHSGANQNTFQIEMFFNGKITINYLAIAATDGLAGLSAGAGLSPDYYASDLSAMLGCQTLPPTAHDGTAATQPGTAVLVTLSATDDGAPFPPGALTYVIAGLPAHGSLYDPNGGLISAVPYTLLENGNQVSYHPAAYFSGYDSFEFLANDGGTPPDGGDSNVATIDVTVGGPTQAYNFSLDTNPGWSTQGAWAFGVPTGGGSHNLDPSSGHTGSNVYGYNLGGDYTNNMTQTMYLTTTAIDCSGMTALVLKFWRKLGVESAQFDHANVQISANGTSWTTLWSNPSTAATADAGWTQVSYDIAAVADNQPTVYVRWGMGTTDGTITYPGWNIDDIEIWGWVPIVPIRGDMNCDGVVNNQDIDAFVLALFNPAGYAQQYPDCNILNGDFTSDGVLNNQDIDGFVAALFGG